MTSSTEHQSRARLRRRRPAAATGRAASRRGATAAAPRRRSPRASSRALPSSTSSASRARSAAVDDRGQRRAQVVRDRAQQRRLDARPRGAAPASRRPRPAARRVRARRRAAPRAPARRARAGAASVVGDVARHEQRADPPSPLAQRRRDARSSPAVARRARSPPTAGRARAARRCGGGRARRSRLAPPSSSRASSAARSASRRRCSASSRASAATSATELAITRGDEEDAERDPVLGLGDREAPGRRDVEAVERERARDAGGDPEDGAPVGGYQTTATGRPRRGSTAGAISVSGRPTACEARPRQPCGDARRPRGGAPGPAGARGPRPWGSVLRALRDNGGLTRMEDPESTTRPLPALSRPPRPSPQGRCAMEWVAHVAGEAPSDRPESASLVVASPRAASTCARRRDAPAAAAYLARTIGTAGDGGEELRAGAARTGWSAPARRRVELAGLDDAARSLRALAPIASDASAGAAGPRLEEVAELAAASRGNARAAARDESGEPGWTAALDGVRWATRLATRESGSMPRARRCGSAAKPGARPADDGRLGVSWNAAWSAAWSAVPGSPSARLTPSSGPCEALGVRAA